MSCGWEPVFEDGFPLLAPDLAVGGVSYSEESHANLARLESGNFWFLGRNRLLVYLLNRFYPYAGKFLEIGCGTGFVMSELSNNRPDITFYGGEAYISGLHYARQRLPKAEFAQMDACRIPFLNEFDVVGSFDVIEHIDEDQYALQQMNRALKPHGILMITVPQHRWLWSRTDEKAGHKRRYTRQELQEKIEKAGFQVLFSSSFTSFLLPAMVASRFATYLMPKKKTHKPQAGLRLPGIINALFEKVCDCERVLIQWGLSMPFGGSLVVVAKRTDEGSPFQRKEQPNNYD